MNNSSQQSIDLLKVLVVGDWVVDENWVLVEHDSDTSTHVGGIHYRSLVNRVDAQILNLCGAGHVARSLYGLVENCAKKQCVNNSRLQVYCLGLWYPKDTPLIKSLFTGQKIIEQTPNTISGLNPTDLVESSKQPNINCCDLRTLARDDWLPSHGTVRVIRLYKLSADKAPRILYRIDWQTRLAPHYCDLEVERLQEYLWNEPISAIVVYDFHKGCVNENLVNALVERYPNADWYVRTKKMDVDWIRKIPEQKLRLRFIGADYVPYRSRTNYWFHGKRPSREALDELLNWGLFNQINLARTERWVVAQHSDGQMIALHRTSEEEVHGYTITEYSTPQTINVGRSSIVFASCVASLLSCYDDSQPETMLKRACFHANEWTKYYTDVIRSAQAESSTNSSGGTLLTCVFSDAIQDVSQAKFSGLSLLRFNCDKELESWHRSFQNLGIVEEEVILSGQRTQKEVFHLWRGYSCIPGYITIRDNLRADLDQLYKAIQDFKNKRKSASLNCLILSAPGWGKSFLAQKIGEVFNLNPLFFNLAQLTSLEQIIDCFDSISSLQNQQKKCSVLAFFDEIDSKLDGQYAFSMFLSPILDGTYTRRGRTFYLAPCVWLFAGATDPTGIPDAHKTADFMSRINGPTIRLDFAEGKSREVQSLTEQVYLGVQLLQDNFKDVYWVSKQVLQLFYELEMKHGVRSFEQAIRRFKNVQYGQVGRLNLPDYQEISHLINIDAKRYNDILLGKHEKEFVEIWKAPL